MFSLHGDQKGGGGEKYEYEGGGGHDCCPLFSKNNEVVCKINNFLSFMLTKDYFLRI